MFAAEYNNNEEVVLELLRAGAIVDEKNKVSELLTYYYCSKSCPKTACRCNLFVVCCSAWLYCITLGCDQ